MYEDIRPPKDFEYAASRRGALTAILLNQLSGIPVDRAITMIIFSEFGNLLRDETTKAWFSPEYWNYVAVCRDYGMTPSKPREIYDFRELDELTEVFRKRFFTDQDQEGVKISWKTKKEE